MACLSKNKRWGGIKNDSILISCFCVSLKLSIEKGEKVVRVCHSQERLREEDDDKMRSEQRDRVSKPKSPENMTDR